MNRFAIGPVVIGSTVLWQTLNVRVNPGIQRLVQSAQRVDTAFAGAIKQLPLLSFDTHAIAKGVGAIGFAGENAATVDVYFRALEHGGTFQAGSKHVKVTLYDTLGILRRIRANQWAEAVASFDVLGVFDGSQEPIAIATDQALPAYTTSDIEKFTVGPGSLDAVPLDNIQSFELDTGIREVADGQDGGLYARFAAIHERQPIIRVTTFDSSSLHTIDEGGSSQDDATFFLRGLTNKGEPIDDATAGHISIVAKESHVTVSDMGETTTIEVQPVYDGTNDLLSITAAQAISSGA